MGHSKESLTDLSFLYDSDWIQRGGRYNACCRQAARVSPLGAPERASDCTPLKHWRITHKMERIDSLASHTFDIAYFHFQVQGLERVIGAHFSAPVNGGLVPLNGSKGLGEN